MKIYFRIILLIGALLSNKAYSGWDTEYWQRFQWTMWENDCFLLKTTAEVRLNHGCRRPYMYKFTEYFVYKAFSWLNLGVNYSYIEDKPRGSPHFMYRQRLELEIDPTLTLKNNLTITWRNLMLFIKEQDVAKIRYVFRHRVSLIYPVEGWYNLISVQCSEEVFYHLVAHRFTQSRFIPLQLNFDVGNKNVLQVFFMIRNFEANAKWWRSFVMGTEYQF